MRKATLTLSVLVLGFIVASMFGVQLVHSQYTPSGKAFILVSPLAVTSPSNRTYTSQPIPLNVTLQSFRDLSTSNITIVFSLDGNANTTIPLESTRVPIEADIIYPNGTTTKGTSVQSYYQFTGLMNLPEMPEGSHNLTVYGQYEFPGSSQPLGLDNRTIHFAINDGIAPTISVLSLDDKAGSPNSLLLNFTTDQPTSWMGYSLDEKANVTITGNTTIADIAIGVHNLRIYANDTVGNMGASEEATFEVVSSPKSFYPVNTPSFSPTASASPSPTIPELILVAVLGLAVAVCIVALTVTRKLKRAM